MYTDSVDKPPVDVLDGVCEGVAVKEDEGRLDNGGKEGVAVGLLEGEVTDQTLESTSCRC